jgi:hypothetical protein
VKRFSHVVVLSIALLAATSPAATAALGWPEVIAKLTTEKRQAEVCIGLLKSRGNEASIDTAKRDYELAKTKMDGVIAGLTTVLVDGGRPESLPAIQDSLSESGAR